MKETFIKKYKSKSLLGLDSSEDIPNFTNNDIPGSNIRCGICIRELWNEMPEKFDPLKELHFLVRALNKIDNSPGEEIFGVCKKSQKNWQINSS